MAFTGQCIDGYVWCLRRGELLAHRSAHFLPLGCKADRFSAPAIQEVEPRCVGVIVFVAPHDLTSEELRERKSDEPGCQELHRAVAELRRRQTIRGASAALVGESDAMRRARRQVELAAHDRAPAFVVGSDAWQRRKVAEAIAYVKERRASEVVIPFDGRLLDESLLAWSLESVAERGRAPCTLIFHDVHELPGGAQVYLAERIMRWPSEWRVVASSAPIVAGDSTAPLDARLFHWLSTLVINLPPLDDRMDDLPLLCQFLIEEVNAESSKQVGGFSQAALDRMHCFDWPGGLAQLREVVAAAHLAAKGPEIAPADLPPPLSHVEAAAAFPPETLQPIRLEELLARIETSLIRRALEQSGGNKTQAATLLSMTRPRLYRRMEQLGMA
jgi:DNA-binding NtrC family response regulator